MSKRRTVLKLKCVGTGVTSVGAKVPLATLVNGHSSALEAEGVPRL